MACQVSRLSASPTVGLPGQLGKQLRRTQSLHVDFWGLPLPSTQGINPVSFLFCPSPSRAKEVAGKVVTPSNSGRRTPCFSCRNSSSSKEKAGTNFDGDTKLDMPEVKERTSSVLPVAPVALLVAAALLLGNPSEGLAASSGGRVGGSKFKSSAPSRSYSAPSKSYSGGGGSSRSYNNYNLNIHPPTYAPPIYGGGYGGYYGGGVPFFGGGVPFFSGPSFYVGGGGLLQFLLVPVILFVVLNVVGGFFRNRD